MNQTDQDVEAMRFLTTAEGRDALRALREMRVIAIGAMRRLRERWGEASSRALVGQHALTDRIREKFGTDQFLATDRALQQATDHVTARFIAGRIPTATPVIDWCCGIGGNLKAFADRGPARGVDRDPVIVVAAAANAPQATVECGEVDDHLPQCHEFLHADPDRRILEVRTSQLEFSSPSIEVLELGIRQARGSAIKLAPGADVPSDWTNRCERQWISYKGVCRQQVAWFGEGARVGERFAVSVKEEGAFAEFSGPVNLEAPEQSEVQSFLFDLDPAVRASGLTAAWCVAHDLATLGGPAGFLTGHQAIDSPLASCFQVLEVLPLDLKQLRNACRARQCDVREVKVRGISRDPRELQSHLRQPGGIPTVLLLGRRGLATFAALAIRRVGFTGHQSHS